MAVVAWVLGVWSLLGAIFVALLNLAKWTVRRHRPPTVETAARVLDRSTSGPLAPIDDGRRVPTHDFGPVASARRHR